MNNRTSITLSLFTNPSTKRFKNRIAYSIVFLFLLSAIIPAFSSPLIAMKQIHINDKPAPLLTTSSSDPPTEPVACFTYQPMLPYAGDNVHFDASCSYNPACYTPEETEKSIGVTSSKDTDTSTSTSTDKPKESTAQPGGNTPNLDDTDSTKHPTVGKDFSKEKIKDSATSYDVITSYQWDFGDGSTSNEKNPTHIYTTATTYSVTLTITTSSGATGVTTTPVTVALPPTYPPIGIIDDISPNPALHGQTITFQGHGFDSDGTVVGYNWRSSIDGPLSTASSFTCALLSSGIHTIFFKVQDNDGYWSPEILSTLVINKPPIARTGGPYFGWVSQSIKVDGSGSTDSDGTIVSWNWNFGDKTTGYGKTLNHVYANKGVYTITLTVIDNNGGTNTGTTSVTIVGPPPVANASGPYKGYLNNPLHFNGSHSFDPDGTITTYAWEFGDGTKATGKSPIHTYTHPGTYLVMLTVTDNSGQTDKDTTSAVIANNSPPSKPEFIGPISGECHTELNFTTYSIDSNAENISYVINWGNSIESTPFFPSGIKIKISHQWTLPGTFNISVYAKDINSAVSESTNITILITEANYDTSEYEENTASTSPPHSSSISGDIPVIGSGEGSYILLSLIGISIGLLVVSILRTKKNRF